MFRVRLTRMHIKMYPTPCLGEPTSRHFARQKQESHKAHKFKPQSNPSKRQNIIYRSDCKPPTAVETLKFIPTSG